MEEEDKVVWKCFGKQVDGTKVPAIEVLDRRCGNDGAPDLSGKGRRGCRRLRVRRLDRTDSFSVDEDDCKRVETISIRGLGLSCKGGRGDNDRRTCIAVTSLRLPH
jgi:hypothetical protein